MLFPVELAAFLTETRLSPLDLSTVQPDSGIPLDSGKKVGPYVIKTTFCNLKNSSPADSNRTCGAVYSPHLHWFNRPQLVLTGHPYDQLRQPNWTGKDRFLPVWSSYPKK